MGRGLWVSKKNTVITFIEMKLSALSLILQINFDSRVYNAGERGIAYVPGECLEMKLEKIQVFAVVSLLYLLLKFFFFLTIQTCICGCEHINRYNSVFWASFCI